MTYSGDVLTEPGAATALAADVAGGALAAANRTVTFSLSDGEGGTFAYSAVSDLLGHAATAVSPPEGVYSVVATVAPTVLQPGCSTAAAPNDTLLAVTVSGARFGGSGTITPPAGMVRFGFHLRTLADGTPSGHLHLRIWPPTPVIPSTPIRSFRATTVAFPPAPIFPPSPCRAQVVGAGVLDGQPGYTYSVTGFDRGRKATDLFSVVLTGPDGSVVYSSGSEQPLSQGRITAYPPGPTRATDPCLVT